MLSRDFLALSFAHNTGRQFRPDPEGVSSIAHVRCLGHLLSSALRHGTTRHLSPHHANPSMADVPADAWHAGEGAFSGNVAVLAEMEMRAVRAAAAQRGVPISGLHYDAVSDTIQDDSGRSLRNRDIANLLARLDPAASGVGEKALLRAVVSQSALQGHDVGRGAGMDALRRDLGAGESTTDRSGGGLLQRRPDEIYHVLRDGHKLLYRKPASTAAAGRVTTREAQDALRKLRSTAPALAQNVTFVKDRSELRQQDYHPKDWEGFTGEGATEAFFDPRTGGVVVIMDNVRVREGETPSRAVVRAMLHERIGHAGLAALRQSDPKFQTQWDKLLASIGTDESVADEIAALREQGYDHLTDDQLVEEWFARQVERMTPEQLNALKPTSSLGKLWQWFKDMLKHLTGRFNRAEWKARELQEMMALSRQALERGGPQGNGANAGRVMQAQVGDTLREADRTLVEEAPDSALLNTRGSNEQIARNAASAVQQWPNTLQAADGTGIDLRVADRGSHAARVWHLIRDEKTNRIQQDKAAWLPRVPETLARAQVRLVDAQTGNRVYVRKYADGVQHAVVVKPDGKVESQRAFTGSLTTQFPLGKGDRQFFMRVDWVRSDLTSNGEGRRQNAPNPTPPGSTVSGPRQGAFQNDPTRPNDPSQATGRVSQSKPLNPFHAGDVPRRTPNWLLSRLRLPKNAPFRVQALGLRSILKGSPLPAELVPFVKRSERDIAAVRQSAAQIGADLNAAITAYAERANVPLESAHALVAQAMEFPAVLNALGDSVLKERVRRARNFLDDLSQATAAHTGGELGQAILQNRGHWMRRSYAAFDPAANWSYDSLSEAAKRGEKINGVSAKKILDEARSYIEHSVNARRAAQRQRGVAHNVAPVTPGEVEAMMRMLTDRNTWESNLLGNMGGSGISKA